MPCIVKESNVIRQQSVFGLYKPTEAANNPNISWLQLVCDVVAELDVAPELSSGRIRLRTHLPTASVCTDTSRKHVCMELRDKPKYHFWGFQQTILGILRHFKDSRFLSEEVWTGHPCLRSPDILFIMYPHGDLAVLVEIVRFNFFPHILKSQKGLNTFSNILPTCCLLWHRFRSLNVTFSFYTFSYWVT